MNEKEIPQNLAWLSDSPLFMDEAQVTQIYDAVLKPEGTEKSVTISMSKEEQETIKTKLGVEGSLETSLINLIPFMKAKLKVGGEVAGEDVSTVNDTISYTYSEINTPYRQFLQLVMHYIFNLSNRIYLPQKPDEQEWRKPENILISPRELVFLDLPGQDEAAKKGLPSLKIIPTAAEVENGEIVLIYNELLKEIDKENKCPKYPEVATAEKTLVDLRKEYWGFFDKNFSATQAMLAIEKTASQKGKISWIDYRVPISNDGTTIHLHLCPNGKYSTGTFAYNLVKRGFKHGLRIIGTVKSEPDINVLAIYEK